MTVQTTPSTMARTIGAALACGALLLLAACKSDSALNPGPVDTTDSGGGAAA